MADNLNIIKSKIVSNDWDVFWQKNTLTDEFKKSTLVLTSPYSSGSADEVQLLKILQACTLSPDMYHIIQIDTSQQTAWHHLRDHLDPEYVLLFGVMPQQLGISSLFRIHEPNKFNERIFIPSLSVQDLEQQQEAKKQLWLNGLKPVFVDKLYKINRS